MDVEPSCFLHCSSQFANCINGNCTAENRDDCNNNDNFNQGNPSGSVMSLGHHGRDFKPDANAKHLNS